MEMTSKRKCSNCAMQIMAPPYAHAIKCAVCQTTVYIRPNNPLDQAHDSICHVANRFKDLLSTASSNINMTVATMSNNSGSLISQQARPSPSPIPLSAHGRKRAVLCGVSYYGQKYKLNGTVNDVNCMRFFLTQKVGFPSDSILVLTEEESHPSLIPTKNNIRNALRWLVQGSQSGDSLVFHFSGHGSQQSDLNGDEIDGYDEALWPVDHQSEGRILDDEINAIIVRPLPRGAKVHSIIDACHSGTILDLPFVCRMNRNGYYMWEDHGRYSPIYKGTNGGVAVSLSACDDHQVSVDTTAVIWINDPDMRKMKMERKTEALSGDTATGAMTYSFIQAAQNEPGLTYGCLLNSMRKIIRDTKTGFLSNGPVTSLLRKVTGRKLTQETQLSSSEKFEIYTRQFVL